MTLIREREMRAGVSVGKPAGKRPLERPQT
jgi:hypothetical protein